MIPTLLTDSITPNLECALHYALLWGLEAVELRSVGGPGDRVPNVNERKLRGQLMESDMPVVAVAPALFEGDLADRAAWLNEVATLVDTLRFCSRIDCSRIVVSGFRGPIADVQDDVADPFRRAAARADVSGIQLCVSNSAAGLIRTGAELSTLLDAVGNSAVTAAWNPMEAAMAGEDPSEGVDALEGRIGLVRCSNGRRSGNGWEARTIDNGAVDWADQIRRLRKMGFAGPLSLEIRAEPRAVNGLREATTLIRMLRAK